MKKLLTAALALLVALVPFSASALEAQESEMQVWSATVRRVESDSLLVRIEQIDPQSEAGYPWDEDDASGEEEDDKTLPLPGASQPPEDTHRASADSEDEREIALLVLTEETLYWQREEDGYVEAALSDLESGDLVSVLVQDGVALEIVIEPASAAEEIAPDTERA